MNNMLTSLETINNVVDIPQVPGLSKVICESGSEYSTFQGDKWRGLIGKQVPIDYEVVEKKGSKGGVFKNNRIVEEPVFSPKPAKFSKAAPTNQTLAAFQNIEKKLDLILGLLKTPEGKLPPEYDF